ncbi:hypothetical protein ACCO45_013060 [Purpureocillium lilacinum]|uniref:Uncharacterized protein n=1 Tax=Purpureocillium lilacinum TaxID=33203 RepID=A0ACC4DB99_PURLI
MKVFAIVSAIMAASASVAFAAPVSEPLAAVAEKRETNLGGLPLAGMIPGGANNPSSTSSSRPSPLASPPATSSSTPAPPCSPTPPRPPRSSPT